MTQHSILSPLWLKKAVTTVRFFPFYFFFSPQSSQKNKIKKKVLWLV